MSSVDGFTFMDPRVCDACQQLVADGDPVQKTMFGKIFHQACLQPTAARMAALERKAASVREREQKKRLEEEKRKEEQDLKRAQYLSLLGREDDRLFRSVMALPEQEREELAAFLCVPNGTLLQQEVLKGWRANLNKVLEWVRTFPDFVDHSSLPVENDEEEAVLHSPLCLVAERIAHGKSTDTGYKIAKILLANGADGAPALNVFVDNLRIGSSGVNNQVAFFGELIQAGVSPSNKDVRHIRSILPIDDLIKGAGKDPELKAIMEVVERVFRG